MENVLSGAVTGGGVMLGFGLLRLDDGRYLAELLDPADRPMLGRRVSAGPFDGRMWMLVENGKITAQTIHYTVRYADGRTESA